MLSTAAQRPSPSGLLSIIYQRFVGARGDLHTHGIARFEKRGERLAHSETELTFQPNVNEGAEAFSLRVLGEATDGDLVEFRVRDGKVVAAQVTRRSAQPLQIEPGESFEAFAQRVRHYRDAPRA
jgi:hypothetical protein